MSSTRHIIDWPCLFTDRITSVLYFVECVLCVHGCILTPEEKAQREERREEKRTMGEYEEEILKSPAIPMTPGPNTGGLPPMTPASFAFGPLGNGSDLPLRENATPANPRASMQRESAETLTTGSQAQPFTLFPPPKAITK